jgi:hypothetical protein
MIVFDDGPSRYPLSPLCPFLSLTLTAHIDYEPVSVLL